MKKNNKGFMLVEILVVSVFVSSVLIVLFVQFKKINNNYNTSFNYNTVEGLYLINSIKDRIITNTNTNNFNTYESKISDDKKYIDVYSLMCANDDYDSSILKNANISALYFARKDAKNDILDDKDFSIDFKEYVSYMNFKTENSDYFLIAEFTNGTYASVNF